MKERVVRKRSIIYHYPRFFITMGVICGMSIMYSKPIYDMFIHNTEPLPMRLSEKAVEVEVSKEA